MAQDFSTDFPAIINREKNRINRQPKWKNRELCERKQNRKLRPYYLILFACSSDGAHVTLNGKVSALTIGDRNANIVADA